MHLRALSLVLLFIALILPLPTHGDGGDCSMALPPRLAVGIRARISSLTGSGLSLYANPGKRYREVVNLPDGAMVDVIGGPTCTDAVRWWQVRTVNGTSGWLPERDATRYWLEPWPISLDVVRRSDATGNTVVHILVTIPDDGRQTGYLVIEINAAKVTAMRMP